MQFAVPFNSLCRRDGRRFELHYVRGSLILVSANRKGAQCFYEPSALALDFDRSLQKRPRIRFSIQRHAEIGFAENKYYSEGPIRTAEHIALLESFERQMKILV